MALKRYIGARYAPKFVGAWDKNSEYAALSVVYTNDQSYVSRKTVPAQTEITNTEYWIKSADWNAQVTQYNQNVEQYNQNVEQYNQNVESYEQAVSQFYADTLHSYDTKAAMVADTELKLGETLLTCGENAIGDGGGSFYQVVAQTSAKAVALENGLFALPFEFQPYDYSEFQGEVDRVIESFNANTAQTERNFNSSVAQIKAVSLNTYSNVNAMKADVDLTADTTVLTTGESQVGDNKGSFYRVQNASDRSDAVSLNNGKKAVPFALNVGAISGSALNFNQQSTVPAMWNMMGGSTITIALPVAQGATASTFLCVLYGATRSTATVNLNINNDVRSITFTDSGDGTHDKLVVYNITVKRSDTLYYGSAVVSSWNVGYSYDVITTTVTLGTNAPASANVQNNPPLIPTLRITPTVDMTLKKIQFRTNAAVTAESSTKLCTISVTNGDTVYEAPSVNISANTLYTIEPNIALNRGTQYSMLLQLYVGNTGGLVPIPLYAGWDSSLYVQSGTYGSLTVSNVYEAVGINCTITYETKK